MTVKPQPSSPPILALNEQHPAELAPDMLVEIVRATALLSSSQGIEKIAVGVAEIACRTLNARFALVALLDQAGWSLFSAGEAPALLDSLRREPGAVFFEQAMRAAYTFRQKSPASDRRTVFMQPDSTELLSLVASPVRIKDEPAGLLMAFGKIDEDGFTDSDAFLAELLALQAASLFDSSRLYQDLENHLNTTQILYDLTRDISQAEDLQLAAQVVAQTAQRLFQPEACGLLLFAPDGNKEAEARLPQTSDPPYELVKQVVENRQQVYMAIDDTRSLMCVPVQTTRRCYGALWLEVTEGPELAQIPEKILHLMNQAVVALERSILLDETWQKTRAIELSYRQQEEAYEHFLEALTRLLEARDDETKEHSARVRQLSKQLGTRMNLSKAELEALDRGALLHDIGKINVRDGVLLKKGPLNDEEWEHMRTHPTVGAGVVQLLPAWQDALPVIAYHQERWDGSGYPLGLAGTDIPLLARIFAVVDVYDALTSDRPYRSRMKPVEALEYLESQANIHFDPLVVEQMTALIRESLEK